MVSMRKLLISLLIVSFVQGISTAQSDFQWQTVSPESQGLSTEKLNAMQDTLAEKGTKGVLVIRNDKIVYEWYAPGHGADRRHYTASLAKALVGGMSLTLALNDGLLNADDPACKYVPEWKEHPQRSKITIRHLATHSSGVENAILSDADRAKAKAEGRTVSNDHMTLPGWKGAFWRKEPDPFTISRDQAPIIFPPGAKYDYSNPGMAMLAYAVTASLKGTEHTDIRTLLRERIMKPIGVADDQWSIGYGKTYEVNGLGLVANWGGGEYTARATARVGRLMLRKGNWQGKQLINPMWVEEVVKYAGTPLPDRPSGNPNPASGLGWYTNFDGAWPKVPRDAFAGAGAGNQVLLVVPSLDLIIVRNGANLFDTEKGEGFWGGIERYLFNPVMESITTKGKAEKEDRQSAQPYFWPKDMRGMNVICRWIDESDIEHLAQNWKANSVRIWARQPMETLKADVELLRKHGLYVIICHQPPDWRKDLDIFWNSQEKQKEYIDWWVQVAEMFKDTGDGIAYDLMNEPHDSMMKVWNSLYPEIAKAIRRVDKVHPIVLEPPGWGWPYGFKEEHDFKPIDDDNTVYSFHMYDPMDLTHVRKEGMKYPGNVDGNYWDKETIRSRLQPVLDFARKHNVTVWCGEVGCTRWAYGAQQYLKDCIDIFEQNGIGWSVYSYREWWNNMDYEKDPSNKSRDCLRSETEIVKMFKEYFSLNPPIKAAALPPYPASDVITKAEFAPASSIVRKAGGSDNWPMTWADDDNQYTAYGDGWGFEPRTEKKLSVGFAKIIGSPTDFQGVNIRTQSGERLGDGKKGPKASGMLMVDGVLYMLARNTGNSQLVWSKDYGKTWTWCDWKFTTSFGYPTFLNFGKNYVGARDEYVYIYSNDNDSAYLPADRMVMARVPRGKITERGAYEFFKGLNPASRPVWTKDIAQRRGVFEHKGKCYRSGISYNPGLKRYLWCQIHPQSSDERGPRFQGGFGIYDAPEPWGPWTTVFFAENWDVGPGETSSLPTKWFSDDGKTCHLVFSGDDFFSVRKITFTVKNR